nr:hypothetical protein CFP56_13494 [Quercus suber]
MADAMCGPSNPLQQFSKQSSRDRTLQQDRLTLRHSSSQGFRSTDRSAGRLDPEFEAFQTGRPPSELAHYKPPQFQSPAFLASSQASSWASDFQRLEISSPSPMQSQRTSQTGPLSSNWAQGFQQHFAQVAPRAQSSSPSPSAFQQRARYGATGVHRDFSQPAYLTSARSTHGKEAMVDDFDQAAFDRAFDQAQHDIMAEVDQQDTAMGGSFDEMMHTDLGVIDGQVFQHETPSDRVAEPSLLFRDDTMLDELRGETWADLPAQEAQHGVTHDQEHTQQGDDDALAATAQELLEKVEHNQTDKFKNSQFLGLMRKLRDREMKVEGDKMVETVSPTILASSPPDSTYASGNVSPAPLNAESSYLHTLALASATIPRPDSGIDVVDEEHAWDHWESPYS